MATYEAEEQLEVVVFEKLGEGGRDAEVQTQKQERHGQKERHGPRNFWTIAPLRYAAKFDPFLS